MHIDKAAAEKAKKKRGRKRKAAGREADDTIGGEVEGDVDTEEVGSSSSSGKGKRAKRTKVQELEPKPWRAPVAPMYSGAA